MDLSHDHWKQLSAVERESVAKRLLRELPSGFEFVSIQHFNLGKSQHHVAIFRFGSSNFSFIPSGTFSIGFDVNEWNPTSEELESWKGTSECYGIEKTIHEYVIEVTRRTRQVVLSAFLIETIAGELGGKTHSALAEQLKSEGFRFPASDEWEHVCGGGESTLFRWGDHGPCDRYPSAISLEEAAFRRRWVASGGTLEYPAEGFKSDWDYHQIPNALGLSIASDPYKSELVSEIGTTRGGDGGGSTCGGAGFFMGWLPLATAYFEEDTCKHNPDIPLDSDFTVGRRVLQLS